MIFDLVDGLQILWSRLKFGSLNVEDSPKTELVLTSSSSIGSISIPPLIPEKAIKLVGRITKLDLFVCALAGTSAISMIVENVESIENILMLEYVEG